jgi:hypothetical protein
LNERRNCLSYDRRVPVWSSPFLGRCDRQDDRTHALFSRDFKQKVTVSRSLGEVARRIAQFRGRDWCGPVYPLFNRREKRQPALGGGDGSRQGNGPQASRPSQVLDHSSAEWQYSFHDTRNRRSSWIRARRLSSAVSCRTAEFAAVRSDPTSNLPSAGQIRAPFPALSRIDRACRCSNRRNGSSRHGQVTTGTSRASTADPHAQMIVRVTAQAIFPNCPRYIPTMALVTPSIYVPKPRTAPVEPAWKSFPEFKDAVHPRQKASTGEES